MAVFELAFRSGVTTRVSIDDRNLLFCATHRKVGAIPDQTQVIADALQNPIGADRLDELLSPEDRVVIIADDYTRPTPTAKILPFILEQIAQAGIPDTSVVIFMGLGTHRPMTEDQLVDKLGDDVVTRFKIVNREYRDGDFVDLGLTESGTPVEVDRQVLEADLKITIGNVVPHATAGWGGGSKMILPGVCSSNTSDRMHLMACVSQPVMEVLGVRDNKARAEMDAVAAKVGLDYIVNTVLDGDQNILGVFAGHFVEAHRAACQMAKEVMVIPIPALADILIASANPCHVDYWQGIKGFAYGQCAVREGGVFILLLDGSEGLCGDAPSHEETVRKYLPLSFEEQKAAVERGEVHDLVGLNVPMYHAMLRHRVERTICVTNHMAQSDLDALGFESASTVQAALARAYEIVGSDARVGVIPFGGETLARVAPDEGGD